MTNNIAQLISQKFIDGLDHPGDPAADQPPSVIRLPFFRTAGMPQEVWEQIGSTVTMIGEAVVHVIETAGQSVIIPKAELEELRKELAQLKEGSAQ